jgi:hypothetical protein
VKAGGGGGNSHTGPRYWPAANAATEAACSMIGFSPAPRDSATCNILVFFTNGVACNALRHEQPQTARRWQRVKLRPRHWRQGRAGRGRSSKACTSKHQCWRQCAGRAPAGEPWKSVQSPKSRTTRQPSLRPPPIRRRYPPRAALARPSASQPTEYQCVQGWRLRPGRRAQTARRHSRPAKSGRAPKTPAAVRLLALRSVPRKHNDRGLQR